MSILHVLLKMPGGTYRQLPEESTTTLVWKVPSNFSSALEIQKLIFLLHITIINGQLGNMYLCYISDHTISKFLVYQIVRKKIKKQEHYAVLLFNTLELI